MSFLTLSSISNELVGKYKIVSMLFVYWDIFIVKLDSERDRQSTLNVFSLLYFKR